MKKKTVPHRLPNSDEKVTVNIGKKDFLLVSCTTQHTDFKDKRVQKIVFAYEKYIKYHNLMIDEDDEFAW